MLNNVYANVVFHLIGEGEAKEKVFSSEIMW